MSRKNSLEAKRIRRVHNQIKAGTQDTKIDLIEYIRFRTRCTRGQAVKVIMAECVRVDSHPLGFLRTAKGKVLQPLISAKLRDRIQIVEPQGA